MMQQSRAQAMIQYRRSDLPSAIEPGHTESASPVHISAPDLFATLKLIALLAVGGVTQGCAPTPPEPVSPRPRPVPVVRPPTPAEVTPNPTTLDPIELPALEEPSRPAALETLTGIASYYSDRLHNRRTASGIRYDRNALVAAHRTLPFGTLLRVTNLANDRQVLVRVVDRGPFIEGRIIDLSRRAAEELGFIQVGTTEVLVEVLEYGSGRN